MVSLRLAVVGRLLQSLRDCIASLLSLLPLALALMYISLSLYLIRTRDLYRRHPLACVHGPLHTLLPLLQVRNRAATAI